MEAGALLISPATRTNMNQLMFLLLVFPCIVLRYYSTRKLKSINVLLCALQQIYQSIKAERPSEHQHNCESTKCFQRLLFFYLCEYVFYGILQLTNSMSFQVFFCYFFYQFFQYFLCSVIKRLYNRDSAQLMHLKLFHCDLFMDFEFVFIACHLNATY